MKFRNINRRGFIRTTAAGAAALASPAYLRRSMAQGSGEVNIWTYDGFVPDDFKAQFEADTGIRINIRLVATRASSSTCWPPRRPTRPSTS
jgi:spermidine/putrescine transport system substrate-binding protein